MSAERWGRSYCFACRESALTQARLSDGALDIHRRGRAFEDRDRRGWTKADLEAGLGGVLLFELVVALQERAGRGDVAVHLSEGDGVVLVEPKSTDTGSSSLRRSARRFSSQSGGWGPIRCRAAGGPCARSASVAMEPGRATMDPLGSSEPPGLEASDLKVCVTLGCRGS